MLATLQGQTGWDGGAVRYRRVGTPLLILHLLIIAGGETGSRADVAGLLPVALLQSSSAVLAGTFVDRRRECFQYIVSIHPTPRPPTDVQSMNFKTDVPSLYCCHCDHLSTPSHHTFSIKLTMLTAWLCGARAPGRVCRICAGPSDAGRACSISCSPAG